MHSGRVTTQGFFPRAGWLLLWLLLGWCAPVQGWAGGGVHFVAQSEVTAQPQRVTGQSTLTLQGEEAVKNAQIWIYGNDPEPQRISELPTWEPRQSHTVSFDLPTPHLQPGWYHLLLEIRFQDKAGIWLHAALGVEYTFGHAIRSQVMPAVAVRGQQVEWPATPLGDPSLRTTSGPHWHLTRPRLTPANSRLVLQLNGPESIPLVGHAYTQVAVLDWLEDGTHQSRILEWRLRTDRVGLGWQAEQEAPVGTTSSPLAMDFPGWSAFSCLGVIPAFFLGVLVTLLIAFFFSRLLYRREPPPDPR